MNPLALDLDLGAAAQREIDLFLPVLGVIVLGVLVTHVGREIDHLHTERLDAELGTRALEGAAVDRLHVFDSPHGVVRHAASFCRVAMDFSDRPSW